MDNKDSSLEQEAIKKSTNRAVYLIEVINNILKAHAEKNVRKPYVYPGVCHIGFYEKYT